ncbi:MAG: GAF domain-containing protein, partial [Planctomycetaceae bacterium]|nr:GAF domain-containing protein [Planctomycetaceae bacterium]
MRDITAHRETERRRKQQRGVLEGINRILANALTCRTEEELGRTCLSVAEEITGSRMGFITQIGADGKLHDPAVSDMGRDACVITDAVAGHARANTFSCGVHAIDGRVLIDGKPLLINDPVCHSDSVGLPPDNPPLTAFLGVPLARDSCTVGMIAVANRKGGYGPHDIEMLEALAPVIVEAFERKRAEAEIVGLAKQRQIALDAARMGWWHCDLLTRIASWDDRYREIVGATGYQCSSEELLARVYSDDVSALSVKMKAALDPAHPRPFSAEYRITRPDGTLRWIEAHGIASFDGQGGARRATSLVGTVVDITYRKLAEESLRLEEQRRKVADAVKAERERFNGLLNMLPAYVVLLSPDHRMVFANRFFEERFGKFGTRRCYEHLFQRTSPCENCQTYKVLETGGLHRWEWSGPDGRDYDVHDFVFTESDGSRLIMEVGLDITARKQIEAKIHEANERLEQRVAERTSALAESERRLRTLGDQIPGGAIYQFVQRPDGAVAYAYMSAGVERLLGMAATCVMADAEAFRALIMEEDLARVLAAEQQSARDLKPFDCEFRQRTVTGEIRWIQCRSMPRRLSDGSILWDGILVDATERKGRDAQMAKLTRLYAVLSQVNEAIVRANDAGELYAEVCRIVADVGGFPCVWIGEQKDQAVVLAAVFGSAADYARQIKVETDGPFGRGPTGTCIRENKAVVNNDFAVNPATAPWRSAAVSCGFRASAAFPLRRQGNAIGALTLYACDPDAFDAEQV